MPDENDFFDSSTLVGVLNEITPNESFTWYGKVPTRPIQNAVTAEWEVEYGDALELAEFNTPGSEANLVGYSGRSYLSGSLMQFREKKLIDGFVERWTRDSATRTTTGRSPRSLCITSPICRTTMPAAPTGSSIIN